MDCTKGFTKNLRHWAKINNTSSKTENPKMPKSLLETGLYNQLNPFLILKQSVLKYSLSKKFVPY